MNLQETIERRTHELITQREAIQKRMQELQAEFEKCRGALLQVEGAIFELSSLVEREQETKTDDNKEE